VPEIAGLAHPFTAPEVRPETTNLRKMKTRRPMGTTATTLAAKMVPYGTWKFPPKSAMPTGMVRKLFELSNVSAIRNSVQQAVKGKMPAVNRPGRACGKTIDQTVRSAEA